MAVADADLAFVFGWLNIDHRTSVSLHIWQMANGSLFGSHAFQHVSIIYYYLPPLWISIRSIPHLDAIYLDHWRDRVQNPIYFLCVFRWKHPIWMDWSARACVPRKFFDRSISVCLCPWKFDVTVAIFVIVCFHIRLYCYYYKLRSSEWKSTGFKCRAMNRVHWTLSSSLQCRLVHSTYRLLIAYIKLIC